MTVLLKTIDQVPGASAVEGPELSFQVGHVTAREIIRARVTMEVERHNNERAPRAFVGLVQPPEPEQRLNPQRPDFRVRSMASVRSRSRSRPFEKDA
jgi:hypothetical protein